jgi:hypothetical protein
VSASVFLILAGVMGASGVVLAAASTRFPKFVIRRGTLVTNFGKQRVPASI